MISDEKNTDFYWFDFGGVLSPPIAELFEVYYEKTGIPARELQAAMKFVADEMGLPVLAPVENAFLTERQWGARLRAALAHLFPATDTSWAELENFGHQWFDRIPGNTGMIQQVKNMKKAGYRVGILTNNVTEWEPYWQAMIGLNDVVEHIVDSCKVHSRKPEHKFFSIAEQIASVAPERCILIDDLLENCQSAEKRGWRTIHFISNSDCLNKLHKLTEVK